MTTNYAKPNVDQAPIVVIGASAGAVEALRGILPNLPKEFPLPIVVVVHMPSDKKSILAEIFQTNCLLNVREAEDKEPLKKGTIYFAPPDYHVLLESDRRISLSSEEPVLYSRPSIDVLFESAAEALGSNVVGILLTGANNDGSRGLKAIQEAGGIILIQNPKEAQANTMPQAALDMCPEVQSMSLQQISTYLNNLGASL